MDSDFVTIKVRKRRNPHPLLNQLEKLHEEQRDKSKTPPYPYDEENAIIKIPKHLEKEIKLLVRAGNKVQALRKISELTGASLRVSKDYVDIFL
jgi:ribosomal protein L7/L12